MSVARKSRSLLTPSSWFVPTDVGTGSYVSWKGYTGSNVKSVVAQGYDIVMDDDNEYAEVVYLYDIVGFKRRQVRGLRPG